MKVLLPTSSPLAPAPPDGVTAAPSDTSQPVPAEHLDAAILGSAPGPRLADAARRMPHRRRVPTLAAGPDALGPGRLQWRG